MAPPLGAESNGTNHLEGDDTMPIAIIGIGFRGPADATNVEKFYRMISEAREAWSPVPKEKWNHNAFYHPDPNRNGTSNVQGGHYFTRDLSLFDAPFFNMTNLEASCLDPQQRLLLECCYEALENAGIPLDRAIGSNTSVFSGTFGGDYTDTLLRDPETMPLYQTTNSGHSRAIVSNRLSYFFDFKGPSVTVDTACSASLIALHLACQTLRTGECRQAIATGSSVILSSDLLISMTAMRFLSPDGRCYSFDDRANGYARGEGVGCILLKPLEDALNDGDTIRAVIRNTAVNQDGKTPGISFPSRDAQETLIRSVYEKAGLDPLETSYVEAHGTGTRAGDPVEAAAISKAIAKDRPLDQPLTIGSVKANVGHLEGASGITGVIKCVLMLENAVIFPNRNFEKANERIPLHEWKLKVSTVLEPWYTKGPRRLSINSFGYGGTNGHAIIEDARSYLASRNLKGSTQKTFSLLQGVSIPTTNRMGNGHTNGYINGSGYSDMSQMSFDRADTNLSLPRLFILSGFDEAVGKQQAESLGMYLKHRPSQTDNTFLNNLAYTLNERRSNFPWKAAIAARSVSELAEKLENQDFKFSKTSKKPILGFIFTGQGAQWSGMGRELIGVYPVFRESITRASYHLNSIGASWNLIEELTKDSIESKIGLAIYSQPLCTAIQIALVDLLASWNIRPTSVTGHSSGEIAAAYTIGALTWQDAMTAAYYRGVASENMVRTSQVQGAMMAVGMSEEDALPFISGLKQGQATVACVNSPSSITISGDLSAIKELEALMKDQNVFARKLEVQVAYHSHHMSLVGDEYSAAISGIKTQSLSDIEFYSSVTGQQAVSSELGPAYWVANMLGQVKFADSLSRLCHETTSGKKGRKRGASTPAVGILIEIGPHSALAGPIKQILQADAKLKDASITYLTALVRKSSAVKTSLELASKLITLGHPVALSALNRPTGQESHNLLVDLPPYAWNHSKSYWAESRLSKVYRNRPYPRSDLLGVQDRNSNALEPRWRNLIRTSEIPWVKDHKVQSNIVYPAAGYVVMAIEAACQRATEMSVNVIGYKLRNIVIRQALVIPEQSGEVETTLNLRPYNESARASSDIWHEFYVFSVTEDDHWTEHCRGLISVQQESSSNEVDGDTQSCAVKNSFAKTITEAEANCNTNVDVKEFYQRLQVLGLDYGPTFANMTSARATKNCSVGEITISDTASVMPMNFQYPFVLHPSTLDSIFHPLFAAVAGEAGSLQDPMVPTFIEDIFVSHNICAEAGHRLAVYASTENKDPRQIKASMLVVNGGQNNFEPVVEINGLTCLTLARDTLGNSDEESKKIAYNYQWKADPDLLTFHDVAKLCADIRPPPEEQAKIRALEQVGFYYVEQALDAVPAISVPMMQPHHKKWWTCMNSFVRTVRAGNLSCSTDSWIAADTIERARVIDEVRTSGAEGNLLDHIGQKLPLILTKEAEPLSLMREDGRLDKYLSGSPRLLRNYTQAAKYIDLLGHKNPHMTILEVGAGFGNATWPIIQSLGGADGDLPRFGKYDFTDLNSDLFDAAKDKLNAWGDLITYKQLDIDVDPGQQGFEPDSYDVIIAVNMSYSRKSLENALRNVRKLLKPDGRLILVELTREHMTALTIFGTLPGWWADQEEGRLSGATLTEQEWEAIFLKTGFSGLEAAVWDSPDDAEHQSSMIVSKPVGKATGKLPDVLVITEEENLDVLAPLLKLFSEFKIATNVTTMAEANPAGKVCVVLSDLTASILRDPSAGLFDVVKRTFLQSAGLLWVTLGATSGCPTSNLITGLARTVRSENGQTVIVTLDLDARNPLPGTAVAERVFSLFKIRFTIEREVISDLDVEYLERNGCLMIPRVVENREVNEVVAAETCEPKPTDQPFYQPGRPLRVEVGTPGLLDTIHFVDDELMAGELPDDRVEVEVKASGFNFRDVMMALGQIYVETLGGEFSGIVTRVSKSTHGISIGDRVACCHLGTFSNFVRPKASAVQKIPDDMPFEVGAALPVIYCTAYHSAFHIANVVKGDTVLVHAASGGLGQAIVELCQMVGAEVFVTVGSTEKKQLLLDRFHIPDDHIFYSRDGSFAKGVMRMTGGKGVDVIMNSVAGEALRLTWNCIAPYGRFVELGKRDFFINTRLDMEKFARNVTFTAVDLVGLIRERPEVVDKVWGKVMNLLRTGVVKPPSPINVYPMSDIQKALSTMQSGRHMGKLVTVPQQTDLVKVIPQRNKDFLRPDASYVLVGGLGGLGRATALWMIRHGAKNLIFANRSGIAKQEALDTVATLREKGAKVDVHSCDVSSAASLSELLKKSSTTMPPIRGVIQGAMVLKDTIFEKMNHEDFNAAIRPKLEGTWNLHNQLPKDLDFFIMLSSVSGVIGNASQANYAAANTFLDAFAEYRNNLGLPAITLDLGVILGVGYVAENQELAKGMERQGFKGTSETELMALIQSAIANPRRPGCLSQTITGLGTWSESSLGVFAHPVFSHFRRMAQRTQLGGAGSSDSPENVRDVLRKVRTLDEAAEIICTALMSKTSALCNIPAEDISSSKPMSQYGMDSLIAVEMRNWIFREMDCTVPILELLANDPLLQLSAKIAKRSRLVDQAVLVKADK